MEKLLVYGAGGHAKVVIELLEDNLIDIFGVVADFCEKESFFEYPILKFNDDLKQSSWIIAIGDNQARKLKARLLNGSFIKVKHPSVFLSRRSNYGDGSVIMAGVSINSCVEIGCHCIINTNASIDHDCKIGDFVHLSPNVALAGNVHVGEGTHLGIGVTVIQGIKIGRWCTVGAGAVIIRDIPDGTTVVGNPGRIIKKIDLDNTKIE